MKLLVAAVLKACHRELWSDDLSTNLWLSSQLAYHRRNKGSATALLQRLGPARLVFVGSRELGVPTVIWIAHGGTLLSTAPEHLRLATRLECEVTSAVRGMIQTSTPVTRQAQVNMWNWVLHHLRLNFVG